jgi:alpha-tubulin suppressor-like RCC1 family protein
MKFPCPFKFAGLLCVVMLQAATTGAQPVTNIAAGGYHSLFLKSGGSLWAMGNNSYGELGDGTYNSTNWPVLIVASNVTAIAAGGGYGGGTNWTDHSLFLKSDGSLWTMGDNRLGQLGDGSNNNTNKPERIVATNVTAIAAGLLHSLFIKRDGSLWAMGNNGNGQLGDGTTDGGHYFTNRPEQIVASNVTAIAGGYFHSLFVKKDGSLWAMGYNGQGQLGDGTYNDTNRPMQIVASNVTAIAAGGYHSLFLKSGGSLWAMGYNGNGELGDGTYNNTNRPGQIVASNVTAIAAGTAYNASISDHSLFLKSDGSLWAMGDNYTGQLGDGSFNNTNQPVQIVAGNVTAIAAGFFHSLFLKSDGSLWGMGNNANGELGDGTYGGVTNRPEQILAPYNRISGQLLSGGKMQLSFVGMARANYALDRAARLSPTNWLPQATNPAGSFGALVFTNTPDATTNNFWRIRSVP